MTTVVIAAPARGTEGEVSESADSGWVVSSPVLRRDLPLPTADRLDASQRDVLEHLIRSHRRDLLSVPTPKIEEKALAPAWSSRNRPPRGVLGIDPAEHGFRWQHPNINRIASRPDEPISDSLVPESNEATDRETANRAPEKLQQAEGDVELKPVPIAVEEPSQQSPATSGTLSVEGEPSAAPADGMVVPEVEFGTSVVETEEKRPPGGWISDLGNPAASIADVGAAAEEDGDEATSGAWLGDSFDANSPEGESPETPDTSVAADDDAVPEEGARSEPPKKRPTADETLPIVDGDDYADDYADDTDASAIGTEGPELTLPEDQVESEEEPEFADSNRETKERLDSRQKLPIAASPTQEKEKESAAAPLRVKVPQFDEPETPKRVEMPIVTRRLDASKSLPRLTRNQVYLRRRVRNVLGGFYRRPLNNVDHDAWEVMHGMLPYGVYSRILEGGAKGRPVTAVGWLCYNRTCKGKNLLYTTPQGELRAKWGVGVQGHYGQFLAMLAQCRVPASYPMRANGKEFTVQDLVEAEKRTCHAGEELTFKLISLMHYCDSDTKWVNEQGAEWSIPRLIEEEMKQPIRGAACGGTHRLAGLSLAARIRQLRGEPLDGSYARADAFVRKYQNYAFRLQNSDGSLSTEWFRGRGDDDDQDRRIKTTGHILEWLAYAVDDDELNDRRMISAVNYLATLMANDYRYDWEVGPMSHALHALVLYDERAFRPYDNESPPSVAARSASRGSATSNRR